MRSISRSATLASVAIFALMPVYAASQTVVLPVGLDVVEGNTNNGFPFHIGNFGLTTQRYQQVYNGSIWGTGPILITGMFFRPDAATGGVFASTLPSMDIALSTSSATETTLSATFATNIGADNTLVHTGPLALSSAFTGPALGPKAFDIFVAFSTPFLYNPGAGSLLMDVHNFGGGKTTQFDAQSGIDGVGRAYTFASGVGSPTADGVDANALVTQFVYNPVPEPASMLALGVGLVALLRRRRKAA